MIRFLNVALSIVLSASLASCAVKPDAPKSDLSSASAIKVNGVYDFTFQVFSGEATVQTTVTYLGNNTLDNLDIIDRDESLCVFAEDVERIDCKTETLLLGLDVSSFKSSGGKPLFEKKFQTDFRFVKEGLPREVVRGKAECKILMSKKALYRCTEIADAAQSND